MGMWFKAMRENAKVLESKLEITRYVPTQEAYFFLILEYNATRGPEYLQMSEIYFRLRKR